MSYREISDSLVNANDRLARARRENASLMAENATLKADAHRADALSVIIEKVRQWAMVNEIAAVPLDWAGLGAILAPDEDGER